MKSQFFSKRLLIISMAIVLLTLSSSSVVVEAANTSIQTQKVDEAVQKASHYYEFEKIQLAVVYDTTEDVAKATGESLYESLSLMTADIASIPVKSLTEIEDNLVTQYYDIVIYVLQSEHAGLILGGHTYQWNDLARVLEYSSNAHHIFAGGNTKQLLDHVKADLCVYGSENELVDAHHGFVYALWKLSEVLEQNNEFKQDEMALSFANDVKMATLKYFSDNFNDLVMRQVEPQDPLGSESPATIQARIDKFYEKNPESAVKLPREIDGKEYIVDNDTMRYIDAESGEVLKDGYGVDIFPKESSLVSDFILNLLPDNSGLRGPIGGIVDTLLKVLFDYLGEVIGIDASTVEALADALISIPDFIGAIKDRDSSKMKEFLDTLKPMIPIPQEYKGYFDLLIDALFLLRGDFDDIKNFIFSALELVIPEEWVTIDSINLLDVIKQVFTIGQGVVDKLNEGASIVDTIFSVLNEQIIQNLTATFIGNVAGIPSEDIQNTISTISSLAGAVVNFITDFDPQELITEYGPNLFTAFGNLIPDFNIDPIAINTTLKAANLLLVATNVIDGNLQESFETLLKDIVQDDELIDEVQETTQALIASITTAIEEGVTDVTSFKDDIDSTLETVGSALGLSDGVKSAISDASTLVVYVSNDFDISSPSSLTNVSTMIQSLMEGIQGMGLVDFGENLDAIFEIVNKAVTGIYGLIAFIKDPKGKCKEILGKFLENFSNPAKLFGKLTEFILKKVSDSDLSQDTKNMINTVGEGVEIIFQVINATKGNGVQGLLISLLQGASYVITQITGVDIMAYVKLAKSLFGQFIGIASDPPSVEDVMDVLEDFIPGSYISAVKGIVDFLLSIKDVFTNGFKTIFGKLTEWLTKMVTELIGSLTGEIGDILDFDLWSYDFDINIGLGGMSLFKINLFFGLSLGFEINGEVLGELLYDLIFKGIQIFSGSSAGEILKKALSFLSITPIFEAGFELSDFGSGEGFMDFMLGSLGLELTFSGYGFFKLQLFSFKNGKFSMEDFFKIIEWGFGFKITLSRMFTLLDFITGGAGGSLNSIGKYIGLDAISITIFLELALDIVKRAATANQPESGSLTLAISIGFTVSLGIDIIIAVLKFTGTLVITLTFVQDLVTSAPLQIYLAIELIITVTIGFLFWDWDFDFKWSPSGFAPPGYNLTAGSKDEAEKEGAMGLDRDEDGLSDEYEKSMPGLNPFAEDSDADGLSDKFETQTYNTDPGNPDTDGDGLTDQTEYNLKTNPNNIDTDFDGLTDYEEVVIYGTNPLGMDTDGDRLDDYFEVNHAWNLTGITPSVTEIEIGGQIFNDRTDPLNPDTDGDGIIDGNEGPSGVYYGPELYNESDSEIHTDPPLIFNGGYIHPLDNDTDDDSYEQLYDGSISPRRRWLRDMSDYTETHGIWVIYIDTETGEPLPPELVLTNPTNPDSDGDTGATEEDRENPPFGFFLNSDGYELALDPPTDPLDGDTDNDGLIDGLEGTLRPDSNHTWGLNPDTDGDGLGDMQEFELGSNPRSVDTDGDNVADGDEFFIFGTNPFMADTDSDGLEDGEELWLYHSSPFLQDSDSDGLKDYDEVYIYYSDPMDEDSDNDFLTDYEEIFITYTDPFEADTDGDGLLDGEEIEGLPFPDIPADWDDFWEDPYTYIQEHPDNVSYLKTDPNKYDTDGDSLTTLDQYGNVSMDMSDGAEYIKYHTNPTRRDTDSDGLDDGWELWLGKGIIPDLDPIPLNPLSNDTDGDGLRDGTELRIENISTLLNPYVGFFLVHTHNTSAVLADTDGDGLDDYYELQHYLAPDNPDTDNDTLSDYDETYLYFTKPYKNDTDGDGLWDFEEIGPNRTIMTSPLESDTDGDLLPDGAEVHYYGRDPLNPDENSNGVMDGMEIDTDGDGLKDGEEFYVYHTVEVLGGGIEQPDSDKDGLFDGLEVYETFTDPTVWDTDNDTYSDGLEYFLGTDPLVFTNKSTMDAALAAHGLDALMILSPSAKQYETTSIPIVVYDASQSVKQMEYRYRQVNGSWSLGQPLEEENKTDYWYGQLDLDRINATYEFQVIGEKPGGSTLVSNVTFSVYLNPLSFEIVSPLPMMYQTNRLPIQVSAGINYTEVSFRIKYPNGTWTDNITLEYDTGLQAYYLAEYEFLKEYGVRNYTLQAFGRRVDDVIVMRQVDFSIKLKKPPGLSTEVVIISSIAVLGGGGAAIALLAKAGKLEGLINKLPFKKKSGGA